MNIKQQLRSLLRRLQRWQKNLYFTKASVGGFVSTHSVLFLPQQAGHICTGTHSSRSCRTRRAPRQVSARSVCPPARRPPWPPGPRSTRPPGSWPQRCPSQAGAE